jgi:hypothetical protein
MNIKGPFICLLLCFMFTVAMNLQIYGQEHRILKPAIHLDKKARNLTERVVTTGRLTGWKLLHFLFADQRNGIIHGKGRLEDSEEIF